MRDFQIYKAISLLLFLVMVGCGFSLQIYGVGGTISGLGTSSGLVLLNGTESLEVAPTSTSFTFLNKLAEGVAYKVIVYAQPSDKVCTVTDGSGTVATSSVTKIAVTCSPPTIAAVSTLANGLSYSKNVAIDKSGNLYVTEVNSNTIRKITPNGLVSNFAGNGTSGFVNGAANQASFAGLQGIAVDSVGNVYVSESYNKVIRKITQSGVVSTFAGTGVEGYLDGPALQAKFSYPYGLAVDASDNVYVAEVGAVSIFAGVRKISQAGQVTTLAGSTFQGSADGLGALAKFSGPSALAVDDLGNVFVADTENHTIRKISPTGLVTTFAGSKLPLYKDGLGTSASFSHPRGIALDSNRNLYVADFANEVIRKISPSGQVTTLAGTRVAGYIDGIATSAQFNLPMGIAVNSTGVVYVVEQTQIRKIIP